MSKLAKGGTLGEDQEGQVPDSEERQEGEGG